MDKSSTVWNLECYGTARGQKVGQAHRCIEFRPSIITGFTIILSHSTDSESSKLEKLYRIEWNSTKWKRYSVFERIHDDCVQNTCQIELHPYLQQDNLVRYCSNEQIAITAYSPFGGKSYIPLALVDEQEPMVLEEPVLKRIASDHGKSVAQVLLES